MSIFLKDWSQVAVLSCTWSLLLVGFGRWMPSDASAQEFKVAEAGTNIIDRGNENVLSIDDQEIAELQKADLR